MIQRRQDWQTMLGEAIVDASAKPFSWGVHDCALFAADVVRAISVEGIDLAKEFRGRYASAVGARRLAGDLEALMEGIASAHGLPEVPPPLAWRGDIALLDTPLGPALGIIGAADVLFTGEDGLALRPRAEVRRCWRIG